MAQLFDNLFLLSVGGGWLTGSNLPLASRITLGTWLCNIYLPFVLSCPATISLFRGCIYGALNIMWHKYFYITTFYRIWALILVLPCPYAVRQDPVSQLKEKEKLFLLFQGNRMTLLLTNFHFWTSSFAMSQANWFLVLSMQERICTPIK
jgi:hypothetical protein